jgi:hypothetical protein
MRTVLSCEALARRPLSPSLGAESEVTLHIISSCPVSVFKHSPLLTLQMRTVLSEDALARRSLSPPPGADNEVTL